MLVTNLVPGKVGAVAACLPGMENAFEGAQ